MDTTTVDITDQIRALEKRSSSLDQEQNSLKIKLSQRMSQVHTLQETCKQRKKEIGYLIQESSDASISLKKLECEASHLSHMLGDLEEENGHYRNRLSLFKEAAEESRKKFMEAAPVINERLFQVLDCNEEETSNESGKEECHDEQDCEEHLKGKIVLVQESINELGKKILSMIESKDVNVKKNIQLEDQKVEEEVNVLKRRQEQVLSVFDEVINSPLEEVERSLAEIANIISECAETHNLQEEWQKAFMPTSDSEMNSAMNDGDIQLSKDH